MAELIELGSFRRWNSSVRATSYNVTTLPVDTKAAARYPFVEPTPFER